LTNPQKPVILSGWERGRINLRNTRQACRLLILHLLFLDFASSRVRCYIWNLDLVLHFYTYTRSHVHQFCTSLLHLGAGGTCTPFALVMLFEGFGQFGLITHQSGSKYYYLFCADLLTHPIRCLIIDAYLGDIMEKAKKPLEPTKSALVREVEAKLGFKKFELNSLERANKATIVALLVR
jgi:hypothetical protein